MHATDQRAWPGMLPDQRACMAGTSMRKSEKLIRSIDVNTLIYNLCFFIRVKFKLVFKKFWVRILPQNLKSYPKLDYRGRS